MIYSCFNQDTGLYRYFADDKAHAINADQPVPKFPRQSQRVGVPSIEAARPFPSGAKLVGHGWHARGLLVQCPNRGLGQMSDDNKRIVQLSMVLAAGALAAFWLMKRG